MAHLVATTRNNRDYFVCTHCGEAIVNKWDAADHLEIWHHVERQIAQWSPEHAWKQQEIRQLHGVE